MSNQSLHLMAVRGKSKFQKSRIPLLLCASIGVQGVGLPVFTIVLMTPQICKHLVTQTGIYQIAEIVNRRSPSCVRSGTVYALLALTGCPCLFSCFYCSVLRAQYDLEDSPSPDCLVHFCCEACALCQEHRQLRKMGFDMGIGWEANLDRQRRGVMVAPRFAPGMTR